MNRIIRRRALPAEIPAFGDMDPLLARIFAARGVSAADELQLDLARLVPVGRFAGLDEALALLVEHRERGSRILIVGDFDADGATSTAVMVRGLHELAFPDVEFLVPNRFEFGYGLSPELVEVALARKPGLIVTVDNGVSSVAGVAAARKAGIDVLVTDHHLPPDVLPRANVILNPNMADEPFPDKHLAGVGVAFYLIAALGRLLLPGGKSGGLAAGLLDLVALGTVADVVPLGQNNRILVEQGLRRIRAGRCVPGITALLEVAGRDPRRCVASDLGFAAGPRLNAAGRLEDMSVGIRCLLTDDPNEAARIARELDDLNRTRREIESDMQAAAMTALGGLSLDRAGELPCALSLYEPDWHPGVVGIVASRVKEAVHRPVVAFAPDGEQWLKGSARSIPGFHIRDALAEVDRTRPGLIARYGGHAMAAGLSLPRERLDEFRTLLANVASEALSPEQLTRVMLTDGELESPDLTLSTAARLRAAGPWGQAFPEPLFEGEFAVRSVRVMKERHLKLRVSPKAGPGGRGVEVEAVAFNQAEGIGERRPTGVRLVYRPDINFFRGIESLQLIVEHLEVIAD